MNQDFAKLEKNICDSIKEAQIKIGYEKGAMSLFYPAESILAMVREAGTETETETGITDTSLKAVYKRLEGFAKYCSERLGDIVISNRDDRFCFLIPEKGTAYVNESYGNNQFLKAFLECITRSGCKADDVTKVFAEFSEDFIVEENQEFGMVIYFNDSTIDEYIYCVRFDEFGATYHRFSRQDFKGLVNALA